MISIAIVGFSSEVVGYYLIWFLLFSSLAFPYFHMVRNLLGMGYDEIEGASIYGARAFARLAFSLLNDRNKRGMQYLLIALNMLKGALKARKLFLNNLEETLTTLFIINQVESEIEYEPLLALSNGLSQQPLLSHASKVLQAFSGNEELVWSRNFERAGRPKQFWIKQLTVVAAFVAAIGTVVQAILPESQKEHILNVLSQFIGSPSVIVLFLILILLFILLRYLSRIEGTTVKWKGLKKITETDETK